MVSIKHKVTIKTKTAQEETPAAVESPVVTLKRKQPEVAKEPTKVAAPAPEPEKKSNTGKIIGGVAAAAAILAGVYFFGIKGDDKTGDDVNPPTEQVAQAGDVTQPEATSPTDASEEGTAEEKGTVSDAPDILSGSCRMGHLPSRDDDGCHQLSRVPVQSFALRHCRKPKDFEESRP